MLSHMHGPWYAGIDSADDCYIYANYFTSLYLISNAVVPNRTIKFKLQDVVLNREIKLKHKDQDCMTSRVRHLI